MGVNPGDRFSCDKVYFISAINFSPAQNSGQVMFESRSGTTNVSSDLDSNYA